MGSEFLYPPTIDVTGALLDVPSYSPERRALRLIAEDSDIKVKLSPHAVTVNPVFEIDQAPNTISGVTLACNIVNGAEIVRHPLNLYNLPIARAVEVPAGTTLVFHSGMVAAPADPSAAPGSPAYWGNTKVQSLSAFKQLEKSLTSLGVGFRDVVSMTVYLVGDLATQGRMDFDGFMQAYSQFFGTATQPNLPARSTVQVAGLGAPGVTG